MSVTVPLPPYRAPIADAQGMVSQAWSGWFRMLFSRVGETVALSNTELSTAQTGGSSSLQGQINTINAEIAPLYGGLTQGPTL